MTAQKSIRLISITAKDPAAGFGAAHRRDAGRDSRPARRPAVTKPAVKKSAAGKAAAAKSAITKAAITKSAAAAGACPAANISGTGKAAARNRKKVRQAPAAVTARTVRKAGRSRALARARRRASGIKSRMRTAIVVLTVMLCAIMLLGLKAPAAEKGTEYYKYYTSVTVGYQEDIIDIMDRYRDELHYKTADDYMKEVSRINNLEYRTGDLLEVHAGDQLIVPYYSTEFR